MYGNEIKIICSGCWCLMVFAHMSLFCPCVMVCWCVMMLLVCHSVCQCVAVTWFTITWNKHFKKKRLQSMTVPGLGMFAYSPYLHACKAQVWIGPHRPPGWRSWFSGRSPSMAGNQVVDWASAGPGSKHRHLWTHDKLHLHAWVSLSSILVTSVGGPGICCQHPHFIHTSTIDGWLPPLLRASSWHPA